MMEIFKKNFSIIIITVLSLGIIFYLRRQINNLLKENVELKNANHSLKEISIKAYTEIELIKKTMMDPMFSGEPINLKNIQIITEDEKPTVITEDNKKQFIESDDEIEIIQNLDKPPIEMVTIPDEINNTTEFIIMSETIPDLESDLVNTLINNNLVHLPFLSPNIEVIDEDVQPDDNSTIEIEIESPKIIEEPILEPEVTDENRNVLKINLDEKEDSYENTKVLNINIDEKGDSYENTKVLKFNNVEKPKEEHKINIKLQPKENDSGSEKSLDYTNNEYLEINNTLQSEVKPSTPEINPYEYITQNYNINHINLSNLENLNIRDIQNISIRNKIDVKKINSKGDKKINKTKKELCTEIISYLNI